MTITPVVYISGPIGTDIGVDLNEKIARFNRAETSLTKMEYIVLNPIKVAVCLHGECVSVYGEEGIVTERANPHSWQCFMRYNIRDMLEDDCRAICMLPLWTQSPGALLEYQIAEKLKYKVFYSDDEGNITYD